MKYSLLFRILLYIIILFSVFNGWWFVALPLLIFGIWQFSFRAEIICAGVIYDSLFGMVPAMGLWGYAGTITALIILVAIYVLNKVIR